jgi:enamine deaminase RidA (YjgF/YER057c/UK114 family)
MTNRKSIYIGGFSHKNPIPNGCRIGNLIVTGVINGTDPATGKLAPTLEAQCVYMFQHVREIVEAGGGTIDDIIKMTVWLADLSNRDALNHEWVQMFPDKDTRPARHTLPRGGSGAALVQCDFMAVVS